MTAQLVLIRLRQEIEASILELAPPNQRLQAELAIALLEPDLLARANIRSFFPRIFLQRLVLIAVGTKPQRNPIPLAIRFRKRDRHIGDSPFAGVRPVHQRSAANYTPRPVSRQASLSWCSRNVRSSSFRKIESSAFGSGGWEREGRGAAALRPWCIPVIRALLPSHISIEALPLAAKNL
jgi:hypothetical protein